MLVRRTFLQALAASAIAIPAAGRALLSPPAGLSRAIAGIEGGSGGRLGVAMLDTGSGARFGHRQGERFAFCSTFKFLLAAAMLRRRDEGGDPLDLPLDVRAADIVSHSPFSKTRVGGRATIGELCHATITTSDNGAANILLRRLGGLDPLQRFVRGIGDGDTRFDRWEPALNTAIAGDSRDTTTPAAMLANLNRLLLGDALGEASRAQLLGWMLANTTGGNRLRAGIPPAWRVGDKTGTGENGSNNDIAIILPPGRAPILVASYLTENDLPSEKADEIHADVARALVEALG